jgi:hypothetical protein
MGLSFADGRRQCPPACMIGWGGSLRLQTLLPMRQWLLSYYAFYFVTNLTDCQSELLQKVTYIEALAAMPIEHNYEIPFSTI